MKKRGPASLTVIFFTVFLYYILVVHLISLLPILANTFALALPSSFLLEEQRKLYKKAPMRSMFQGDAACVTSDSRLGYRPKQGTCHFSNYEFDTRLEFTSAGAANIPSPAENRLRIAVLGDSHAMGWGVSTEQSFAYLLAEKGYSVTNLSNASYGTEQQLLSLQAYQEVDQFDLIVIQYCDNDLGKNLRGLDQYINQEINAYKKRKRLDFTASQKFSNASRYYLSTYSFLSILRLPFDVISGVETEYDTLSREVTTEHQAAMLSVIRRYRPDLDAPIVVFYSNPYGKRFDGWQHVASELGVTFTDLQLAPEHYYRIDDHLNPRGHKYIARSLALMFSRRR